MSEWIKVKDKLPDNMQIVLCLIDMGADYEYQVCVCRFENDSFVHPDGIESPYKIEDCTEGEYPISHWMNLPEPPE